MNNVLLSEEKAKAIAYQIEKILADNDIHYIMEFVKKPDTRFINFKEISIKIARA